MKAFIFDLDGVLVFTDKFHYAAWKELADGLRVYFDKEINNRLRGVSRRIAWKLFWSATRDQRSQNRKKPN